MRRKTSDVGIATSFEQLHLELNTIYYFLIIQINIPLDV
jgi:hypothetical protein